MVLDAFKFPLHNILSSEDNNKLSVLKEDTGRYDKDLNGFIDRLCMT